MKKSSLLFLGSFVFSLLLLTSGCAIKINGNASYPDQRETTPPGTPGKNRDRGDKHPPRTDQPPPKRDEKPPIKPPRQDGLIQGYATLTFYPEEVNSRKGILGGYVLLFDKPQKARDPFSEVPMDSCQYTEHKNTGKRPPLPYSGLNLGKEVTLGTGGQRWNLNRTLMNQDNPDEGFFYNLTTVQDLSFPYLSFFGFKSEGGPKAKPFSFKAPTPSMMKVDTPLMKNEGTLISMRQPLDFRYSFAGDARQFVVRINQSDQDNELTRSLTCRFSNTGKATIPASHWKKFEEDDDGTKTSLFLFSGAYKRIPLPGYDAPIYSVVESIYYTPAILH
jgi:hypothetical protein